MKEGGFQFSHCNLVARSPSKLKAKDRASQHVLHAGAYDDYRSTSRGWSLEQVAAEIERVPGSCPHVASPMPPRQIFGARAPSELAAEARAAADSSISYTGSPLRQDGGVAIFGVKSFPATMEEIADDPAVADEAEKWAAECVQFLERYFGRHLRGVWVHEDESHFHLHYVVLPPVDAEGRLRTDRVHPGLREEARVRREMKVAGEPLYKNRRESEEFRKAKRAAYRQGMKSFQDLFHEEVSVFYGQARVGPRRARHSRLEWNEIQRENVRLAKLMRGLRKRQRQLDAQEADLDQRKAAQARKEAEVAEQKRSQDDYARAQQEMDRHLSQRKHDLDEQEAVLREEWAVLERDKAELAVGKEAVRAARREHQDLVNSREAALLQVGQLQGELSEVRRTLDDQAERLQAARAHAKAKGGEAATVSAEREQLQVRFDALVAVIGGLWAGTVYASAEGGRLALKVKTDRANVRQMLEQAVGVVLRLKVAPAIIQVAGLVAQARRPLAEQRSGVSGSESSGRPSSRQPRPERER